MAKDKKEMSEALKEEATKMTNTPELKGASLPKSDIQEGIEAEEARLREIMAEKQRMREEMEAMLEEEKKELENFKLEIQKKKEMDKLREEGKLITMARFRFHYQEEQGGILTFTYNLIRYALKDNTEYCYPKYIADHINSLNYPDRALVREPGAKQATLMVVGTIPRCSATVLETFEKVFDPATDLPDQNEWRSKQAHVI